MAAVTEAELLSKLHSPTANLADIHRLFSTYLHPLTALKPTKKPSKATKPPDSASVRALAKQFLPFLNQALSLLPKRLSPTSNPAKIPKQIVLNLFEVYRLCLDSLDLISSQLSCKPYSVHIQRARYIHCLEALEMYHEAENEGYAVLDSLRVLVGSGSTGRAVKGKPKYLPKVNEKSVDQDLALLVVEIVVTLVKCASVNQSKCGDDYCKVLLLLDEAHIWFRVLEADVGEKMQKLLATYMSRISIYLVTESKCYDGELMLKFCSTTFREHDKSYLKVQMHKFARRICSCLFSQEEDQNSSMIGILKLVLGTMATECEVGVENEMVDFLELVSYCANKCCSRNNTVCNDVVELLRYLSSTLCEVKDEFTQVSSFTSSVVEIYAAGLSLATLCGSANSFPREKADGKSSLSFFVEKEDIFLMLNDSLLSIKSYLNPTRGGNLSSSGNSFLLPCLEALKFVCHPLAEFICSDTKGGQNEIHDSSVSPILYVIQEAFDLLCSIFLQYHSAATNGKDVDKTILRVAVAAVTLSCRTKREIKASLILVERIISASWTLANGLKYIFVSLYNIAVTLIKAKRMLEASGVLEIACRASWKCVLVICKILAEGESKCEELLSEDAATNLCNEACAKSALLLDILCQESPLEVERVVKESLESWSAAKTLLKELPSPAALVRQWVKIQCGYLNDETADDRAGTLYSLLSSSMNTSEQVLRFLMEQELVAYKEAAGRNRKVCQKMRMKLMKILSDEFYDKDSPVEKSRILIERGSDIRADKDKDTKESIQCLSEAISTLSEITGDKFSCEANDLLAYAYCLRECWAQEVETEPKTKRSFEDLRTGIDLFSRPRCCHPAESGHRMSGDLLNMLYHMFDLLAIKGFMALHIDIYKLMIQLCEWKKVPVGKLLAVLWKSRRLSHPLCPSPIDPKFISEFCKNHGELDKFSYWTKYMEESQPLIVGFEQSFFSMLSPTSYHHDNAIQSDLTVENIKKAASGLISSVPQSNECTFLAAYLYYDLCERLIQSGHMVEALFYAKEAHRLRSRLLQEKFIYSVDQQEEIYDETGELIQKCSYKVNNFHVRNPATTEAWFCSGMSCDIEGFVLTPWNILQCYLESTLQEGTIHEILGNGSEAETLLLWGKSISCLKSLPMFIVSFSTILGKLYRKQRLWNLANTELIGAREALTNIPGGISCSWCQSVLEVAISQQLGDLHRNRCCNGAERPSFESLSDAMDFYRSVLINLNDQSKTTIHYPGPASTEIIKDNCDHLPSDKGQKVNAFLPKGCRVKAEKVSRQSKKKDEKKNLKQAEVHNLRKTRSRHNNIQNNNGSLSSDMSIDLDMGSNSVDFPTCSSAQSRPDLEIKCPVADILLEVTHLFDKIKCLHCLLLDIHSSSSLSEFVCMRWELACRRLLLRSLISTAKCFSVCGNIHEARGVLSQSLLLLINRNTCLQYSSCPVTTLIDLIGEGFPRNMLIIDGASLLYQICWISLKRCHCNNTSQFCSELSSIGRSKTISWLRMVFILCHEVPIIFQKVSRLLAALYIIYNSDQTSELACKSLSISHWASFFHQAGIGTHHNQELSSRIALNGKRVGFKETEKYNVCRSIASVLGKAKKSSLAPVSEKEFNKVVSSFFRNLPSIRVMCISCIGGADGDLLSELLHYPSSVPAWLLLSRLNADNHPISVLLPANSLAKAFDGNSSPFMHKSVVKRWRCPWASSPVDDVASTFKLILEENYASSSVQLNGNTKRNKLAWWTKRKELDECLGEFLHNMEQSWLGPLKYLLSEEWPDFSDLDSLQKQVLNELGYNDKGDDCQAISKNSPGNGEYPLGKDGCILQIILNGGVYAHKPRTTSTEVESTFLSFIKTLSDTNQLEEINHIRTKPIMLVLDYEVQMLPWESLPILKNQEVYRMPSLYSISITLDRCSEQRDWDVLAPAIFPWIDPLDSYYVLNPGGDLSDTQVEFEHWFKDQHFEGISGTPPTIEVFIEALKNHDLFIYLGHGSGSQYFPGGQIKKLDKCSCTVLMGCSSGSLALNGSYSPQGAPLHYLLAGSPVVIANLWEVTDKDIDRFAKAMLDAWLEERSSVSKNIDECDDVTNELKSLSIRTRGDRRKGRSKKEASQETGKKNAHGVLRNHRPTIGSFIGQARQACKLPYLIGASPVCYGVPTGITKKKKL